MFHRTKPIALLIIVIVATLVLTMAPGGARADTPNPSSGSSGYETFVFHLPGAYTSTTTPVKFKPPWPYRALSVSVHARAVSGASNEASQEIDVKQGSTSLLAAPVQIVNSDTSYSATMADSPNIPDESEVSVILTMSGTNPSVSDVTVTLGVKRQ
jgi:hypothetical protein